MQRFGRNGGQLVAAAIAVAVLDSNGGRRVALNGGRRVAPGHTNGGRRVAPFMLINV